MTKKYLKPVTAHLAVETSILCASPDGGAQFISPKGSLNSINKTNGSW